MFNIIYDNYFFTISILALVKFYWIYREFRKYLLRHFKPKVTLNFKH